MRLHTLVAVLIAISVSHAAQADTVRLAVASNFITTAQLLASQFESYSAHTVKISSASSGKHYVQIQHGAPFDVFMSADDLRPSLLEQAGLGIPGSRMTYAVGRLALWAGPNSGSTLSENSLSKESLMQAKLGRVALANPRLAPYGAAALQVMDALNISSALEGKLVRGENINQAFQFIATGNAGMGFVAYSQLLAYNKKMNIEAEQAYWLVPQNLYSPILQDAIRLSESSAAIAFMQFLKSEAALKIIRKSGYTAP